MVGVLPDVPAVDRVLDYRVPARWAPAVQLGTVVRIPLQGRRVRGWVVSLDPTPPAGLKLRDISRVSGIGPGPELLELAEWAARRWAGRRLTFVRAASAHRNVTALPSRPSVATPAPERGTPAPAAATGTDRGTAEAIRLAEAALDAATGSVAALRWPPGAERLPIALAAVQRGPALLLAPAQADADALARRLAALGIWVARHPEDWAVGAAGATVVGSRAAVWAPVAGLAAVVVFDEHDERFRDERVPHWHAREVAIERARRAGVPALLVSPLLSLQARAAVMAGGSMALAPSRSTERLGWPVVTVVDRRSLDPHQGLYPPPIVEAVRAGGRVLVVHNRTGRARLLACTRCGELCRCEQCGGAMRSGAIGRARRSLAGAAPGRRGVGSGGDPGTGQQGTGDPSTGHAAGVDPVGGAPATGSDPAGGGPAVGDDTVGWLRCSADARHRAPPVCLRCGATRLAVLRPGVSRIREELEALVGEPVEELTAASAPGVGATRVVVGTEAVLHRVRRADAVVFLDLDQELLAPRLDAGERALAQLALAARLVGGRRRSGRLVVATRQPDHAVIDAVLHADPERWAAPELARRAALRLPPVVALALVEGPAARPFAEALRTAAAVEVAGPTDGRWLVKADDPERLAAALAQALDAAPRPATGLRIVVDPTGI